jgi:hypothetical protein
MKNIVKGSGARESLFNMRSDKQSTVKSDNRRFFIVS